MDKCTRPRTKKEGYSPKATEARYNQLYELHHDVNLSYYLNASPVCSHYSSRQPQTDVVLQLQPCLVVPFPLFESYAEIILDCEYGIILEIRRVLVKNLSRD